MERGKMSSGRGSKSKTPMFPVDLYPLGSKAGNDGKSRPTSASLAGKVGPLTADKKRDVGPVGAPPIPPKKVKIAPTSFIPRPPGASSSSEPPPATPVLDSWESLAVDIDPSDFISLALEAIDSNDTDKTIALVCGALKAVKSARYKTDMVIFESLCYIAKLKPRVFVADPVVSAVTSLLRKDVAIGFKAKGNLHPMMLATNLLMTAFVDVKKWPDIFMKVYLDDASGERIWVDLEYCREFTENVLASTGTRKVPFPQYIAEASGIPSLQAPSHEPEESAPSKPSSLPPFPPPLPRFRWNRDRVEMAIVEFVKEQLNRKPGTEMISKNFIKVLSSLCGISEVCSLVVSKLEGWLQNTKLVRVSQELLMSVCANTTSYTIREAEVILALIKLRLKTKALLSFYLSCIKELLQVHKDNLATVLKHTIYNELSTPRNPNNNMAILSMIFQSDPEKATKHLAHIFLDLLYNREDYLGSVKTLLRELGRLLRSDLRLLSLVSTLYSREEPLPRDADPVRSFSAVADIGCLSIFLAVMPQSRGDKKDPHQMEKIYLLVSKMQSEAVNWLMTSAMPVYRPSSQEYINVLHKLLMLESGEAYGKVDNWAEGERSVLLRLATEAPVTDNTLITLLLLGISKEYPLSPQDSLDLTEQLVKRAAGITAPNRSVLIVEKVKLVDFVLNAAAYRHPDNIDLPSGYSPPVLAISSYYWKAWTILLILTAHNPHLLGSLAWEKYPTLRTLMEMCITGHFVYPPGYEDLQMLALEKQRILEFEAHLAAATSKMEITEATSLLLPQLISMEPLGPGRRPPAATLEYIKSLNNSLRLGHLLCRSRDPDFLLDMIQRQGPSQSMPWLADLVHSSDSAHLNMLPVQCLCEFLMSCCPKQETKYQELLCHLRAVIASLEEPAPAVEVLEYFLRRLASSSNRSMAINALKLLLAPVPPLSNVADDSGVIDLDRSLEDKGDTFWLSSQLPLIPHFKLAKPQIIACIRAACLVENDPTLVTAYLCFLAEHSVDGLPELSDLVLDMATLIVERVTIMMAILPSGSGPPNEQSQVNTALDAFVTIFYHYITKAREPRKGEFPWSESQDQVLVSWYSGEECTIHILVVHAMVILLTYGSEGVSKITEYQSLLDIWFPANLDQAPKGFLVDTSEEALLIPDWLKLRMIRSDVPRLVEAALTDLDISQLILFIQSFGIPIPSMSKLLSTLDAVVVNQREAVGEAVLDKAYMAQLVDVQHRRGATGGRIFTRVLELESEKQIPEEKIAFSPVISRAIKTELRCVTETLSMAECLDILEISFSGLDKIPFERENFRKFQLSIDAKIKRNGKKPIALIMTRLCELVTCTKAIPNPTVMAILLKFYLSTPLFRLLIQQYHPVAHKQQYKYLFETLLSAAADMPLLISKSRSLMQLLIDFKERELDSPTKMDVDSEDNFSSKGCRDEIISLALRDSSQNTREEKRNKVLRDAIEKLITTPSPLTGHLIDTIVRLEPEILGSQADLQMQLLFSLKERTTLLCRPYLLTLLTHHASWSTLHTCLDNLLEPSSVKGYDPSAVLDFLFALICHPKLWQGREKHTPKHYIPDDILNLNITQLKCVMDYILSEGMVQRAEKNSNGPDKLFAVQRLSLIKQCISNRIHLAGELAFHLIDRIENLTNRLERKTCTQLLVELYLIIPNVITKLEPQHVKLINSMSHITVLGTSTMDLMSHRLLTALGWNGSQNGSGELELMVRNMAATHPLLTLRQLPLIASTLSGRTDLEWSAFKSRGHLAYMQQISSLLPLLQPYIFNPEYSASFHKILSTYLEMFQNYGSDRIAVGAINALVTQFTEIMEEYVKVKAMAAQKYLQENAEIIRDIQSDYPQMNSFCICVPRDGHIEVYLTPSATVQPDLPPHWSAKVHLIYSNQDPIFGLSYVEYMSSKRPSLLADLVDSALCELIGSNLSQVRMLSHTLLSRYLRHDPTSARHLVPAYLSVMDSSHPDVVSTAVQKLPEFVILTQENGLPLMEKLFNVALNTNVNIAEIVVKVIKLLNIQSAC